MPRLTTTLTVEEVERLAHRLAKETLDFNEPIPDFRTRYPGKLESCLAQPFQRFDRKSLYATPERRTATLFYLMIKNHPFQNLPAPRRDKHVVYVLKCNDGSLYKGYSCNFERRLIEHNKGLVKWTRSRLPVELVYFEEYDEVEKALRREKDLKTGFGRKWLDREVPKTAARQAGGNKRIAMTGMLVLLYKQHKWLRVDTKELYNFAVWVASSPPKLKDEVVRAIERFIRMNIVKL